MSLGMGLNCENGTDCEMLELTGHGGAATQMFTAIDKEIPPGPPDIPKVLEVLK